jgi:hypothetical protein
MLLKQATTRREMMYYRIAIQPRGSMCWQWKSTVLSSLDVVLRFLRLYRAYPAERLRVFSFPSREEMDKQLARENSGLESHSVTAAELLRARLIHTQETPADVPTQQTHEDWEMATISNAKRSLQERSADGHALNERSMSILDRRRIEAEWRAGSDHDLPYSFALPHSWPQVLAWMKLLTKVHTGAVPP